MKPTSATLMGILLVIILAMPALAGRPVPDTGQTKCYDTAGVEIDCADTGQDGAYTINPMSFTKLDIAGNDLPDDALEWAMVRDNVTGLIWEVKQNKDGFDNFNNPHDADNLYTWYDSTADEPGTPGNETDTEDFIAKLNDTRFGGHDDWRMPTREELRSIVAYNLLNPTIDTVYFANTINTVSSHYWSSSTYANNVVNAWCVYFYYGGDFDDGKSSNFYVRAVRGGQLRSSGRWIINDEYTVTDKKTGLMWQRATDGPISWTDLPTHFADLTIGAHTDWRLPTLKELASIADLENDDPSIDETAFTGTVPSVYCSSTSHAPALGYAWGVNFLHGNGSSGYNKGGDFYIRTVRGGQLLISGNLIIITPAQASCWDIGSVMPIAWDPGDVPETEQVRITLSRTGGGGTLQQIAITENDGYHEWKVSGLASWNGWLEIEPTSPAWASKATGVGMFSLQDYIVIDNKNPSDFVIDETPGSNVATFRIRLTQTPVTGSDVKIRLYSGDTSECTVSPSVVVFDETHLTATVTVTALDDAMLDGDQVVTVRADRIESTDPDYRDMTVPTVTVTVRDDEVAPVLTIDSVQPNMFEVNQPVTLTVTGTSLSADNVTDALLVLQKEDGEPDWNHFLSPNQLVPMGTEMAALFPAASVVGQYTLRVLQAGGFEELKGAVTVADSSAVADMQGKKAIIVAGRENATDALWVSTMNNANRAYNALRFQGFSGGKIRYLTHMADMDVDGDGELDKYGDPTKTALQTAVTTWVGDDADTDELIIYMVDHGGEELFHLDSGDDVTAGELKEWLDDLQQNRAVRVIVIVDACMSGGFLGGLALDGGVHAQSERVVIAGAGPNEPAWFQNNGDISFSRYFWDSAYTTGRLFRSFIAGRDRMSIQNPLADRDGDGGADEITLADLFNDPAGEILIGRGRIAASTPPEIGDICDDQTIDCETSATISASDIVFPNGEMSVVARIVPPVYDDAPSDEPVQELPAIRLTDIDQDREYTGTYDDFTRVGVYRIVVCATDKKDVASVPKITRVIRTCGATGIKGDLNKDTETDLTDTLIALKIMAGIAAPNLRTDFAAAGVDVNSDDRVGMAEAIYALQKAAGVR